jgi:hypothetical protein
MRGRQKLPKWYIESRIAYILFQVQSKSVQMHAGRDMQIFLLLIRNSTSVN